MSELPTFTDEEFDEYLGIWDKLIEQGHKRMLDITLTADYGSFAFPFTRRFTLAYGEEKRVLTEHQAHRAHAWLEAVKDAASNLTLT